MTGQRVVTLPIIASNDVTIMNCRFSKHNPQLLFEIPQLLDFAGTSKWQSLFTCAPRIQRRLENESCTNIFYEYTDGQMHSVFLHEKNRFYFTSVVLIDLLI